MTKLLMDERPLQVLPALAKSIGLNEAIIVQQLHWTLRSRPSLVEDLDGQPWVRAGMDYWTKEFPFWSEATIKRAFSSLRDRGLVSTRRGREESAYTIHYGPLNLLADSLDPSGTDQDDPAWRSQRSDAPDQNDLSPIRESQTTTQTSSDPSSAASAAPEPQPEGEQLFDAPPVEPERKSAAKRRAEVPDELVREVWDHWLKVFDGKVQIKELTTPRERVIRSALLAVSLNVELCKRAIDGLKTYRESHSGAIQPATIFETGPNSISNLTDQIEWWAQHAKSNLPSRNAIRDGDRPEVALDLSDVPSVTRGTIQARRIEVVRMFTQPDASDAKERGEAAVDWLRDHVGHEAHWDGEHLTWHQVKA